MSVRNVVELLTDAYVTHELSIRQESLSYHTLLSKKERLIELLELESRNPDEAAHFCLPTIPVEIAQCRMLTNELQSLITDDRVGNAQLVDARIQFLEPRVDRIALEEESEFAATKGQIQDDIARLKAEIASVAVPVVFNTDQPDLSGQPLPSGTNQSLRSATSARSNTNPFVEPSPEREEPVGVRRPIELWKWDLRFSGKEGESASEFLQLLGDYIRSRDVTKEAVLYSLSELFTGSARKWIRNVQLTRPFTSWNDFITRFLQDFEPAHQREELLESIKRRLQGYNESVLNYFVVMEDLFLRLPIVPPEHERVRIIRRNLQSRYINALTLHNFICVEDLKDACQRLEYTQTLLQSRNRNNPPRDIGARFHNSRDPWVNRQERPAFGPRQFNPRNFQNASGNNFNYRPIQPANLRSNPFRRNGDQHPAVTGPGNYNQGSRPYISRPALPAPRNDNPVNAISESSPFRHISTTAVGIEGTASPWPAHAPQFNSRSGHLSENQYQGEFGGNLEGTACLNPQTVPSELTGSRPDRR